jgi:P63C domain
MSDQPEEPTGRAKGGHARAAKLTKQQRSDIARKGAMARKARVLTDERQDQDPVEYQGVLTLGDFAVPCFVTKSGMRLIASRKMQEILKVVEEDPDDQPGVQRPGTRFQRFLTRKFFNSLIPKDELQDLFTPIRRTFRGRVISGYRSEALTKFCELMMQAKDKSLLSTDRQFIVAVQAKVLYDAFAKVGLVALIDEATGYQQIRDPSALRLLVQQYIAQEKREWDKQFPDSFYDGLNRMYNSKMLTRTAKGAVIQNRPQHFANFTRTYVYEPLENGAVLEELDRINPKINAKGTRRDRFHQHLSQGYGIEKLKRQVLAVETLIDVSDNVSQFKRLYAKKFGVPKGAQLDLLDD